MGGGIQGLDDGKIWVDVMERKGGREVCFTARLSDWFRQHQAG